MDNAADSKSNEENVIEEIISGLQSPPKSIVSNNGDISGIYSGVKEISRNTIKNREKEENDILEMRRKWSGAILALIVLIVFFDIMLVWFIGSGVWVFNNTSIVIAVITENFLKIFGLAYFITLEIFKKIYPRE